MYQDYVITAIALLVIALILGGIRVRQFNFPYLYFLFGSVIVSLVFTDPGLVGNSLLRILHPLFIPFLYIVGPGIYGSIQPVTARRNSWHIIHYLPLIIGFILLFLHWFLDPEHFGASIQSARNFDWENANTFYPFSDRYILLGYPFYTALYYLLCIRKLIEYKSERKNYLIPMGMLAFTPFIWDVCYQFIYGEGFIIKDPAVQRYILLGAVLIIFWDVIIIKPPKPKEIIERESQSLPRLGEYPRINSVKNTAMVKFVNELNYGLSSDANLRFNNKANFIRKSPFKESDWDRFFSITKTNWNFLKKYLRIKRVLELIEKGFLLEGTVDELAAEIGYSSRASLYLAFQQIMDISLPEYRLVHEI